MRLRKKQKLQNGDICRVDLNGNRDFREYSLGSLSHNQLVKVVSCNDLRGRVDKLMRAPHIISVRPLICKNDYFIDSDVKAKRLTKL